MAVLNWSTLSSGTYAFNPNVDVLRFDDSSISAADVTTTSSSGVADIVFSYHGKTVTLQTSSYTVTTTNVTFQNGSMLVIGDNTTGTANDDAANTVNGGGGADMLIGAGGGDTLNGGAGNDVFFIGRSQSTGFYGDDVLNGGDGVDTAYYSVTNGYGVNVNLATGHADGGDANHPGSLITMNSIEAVSATPFDDNLTGSGANEFFFGRGGNDNIDGGGGTDTAVYSGAHANYSIALQSNGSVIVTDTRGGSPDGTDTLRNVELLQFSDGTISAPGGSSTQAPPVVTPTSADASVKNGQTVTAASLFTASDPNGDTITTYRFYNDAGGGHFTLNGIAQVEGNGESFDVTAAQLGNLRFVGGGNGTERVFIAASDNGGATFGDSAMFNITSANQLPVVIPPNGEVSIRNGQTVAANTLFSASDPDGDAVTTYRFYNDAGGGHFTLNGVDQVEGGGQTFDVTAAQLGNLRFVGGGNGTERVFVAASDDGGATFGDPAMMTITSANHMPVVTPTHADTAVRTGQSVASGSLFTVTDADGDTVTTYRFYNDAGGGHFTLNGVDQVEGGGQAFDVTAAQLGNLRFVGGGNGTERVFVAASDDGGATFGDPAIMTITSANHMPVVTAAHADAVVHDGQSVAAGSHFSAADADGDAVTNYLFYNDAGGGHFTLNGAAQAEGGGQSFSVTAAQLGSLRFVGGGDGTERVFVAASDDGGVTFGDPTQFTVSAHGQPVVTAANANVTINSGQSVAATSLFSAADPDGDAITSYRFYNDAGGGHFELGGVAQVEGGGQSFDVAPGDLANLRFVGAGAGTERIFAAASDSVGFGAAAVVNVTTLA